MMALVNYSSSSENESENDDDQDQPEPKIMKFDTPKRLPLPPAIKSMNKVSHDLPVDDPSKHDGRIRSFEHERGNWATLVYISVDLEIMDELQNVIQNFFKDSLDLRSSENIHLSLTKTVVLRHYWIDTFVKSLQQTLKSSQHFPLDFQSLKVYTNEERTRTFVGLVASDNYFAKLHQLMQKMDTLMREFQLDTFYEDPSFHASILWCLGDSEKFLKEQLPKVNDIVSEMINTNLDDFQIKVKEIHCKTGNKLFTFELK